MSRIQDTFFPILEIICHEQRSTRRPARAPASRDREPLPGPQGPFLPQLTRWRALKRGSTLLGRHQWVWVAVQKTTLTPTKGTSRFGPKHARHGGGSHKVSWDVRDPLCHRRLTVLPYSCGECPPVGRCPPDRRVPAASVKGALTPERWRASTSRW